MFRSIRKEGGWCGPVCYLGGECHRTIQLQTQSLQTYAECSSRATPTNGLDTLDSSTMTDEYN